jgi:hypothetical protein
MNRKEKILTAWNAFKAVFDSPAVPAPAGPTAPAPTSTSSVFSYGVDGGGTIYVDCSDDGIAGIDVADNVFSDPAMTIPYPDGTYNVTGTNFGFTVASGAVTNVTDADGTGPGQPLETAAPAAAAAPPTPPAPVNPAKPSVPPTTTQMAAAQLPDATQLAAMYAAFATGSSDDRLANLELVARALMEYSFGWQIREAQQKAIADQAINIYKQDLVTAQAALAKQEEKLKAMFNMMETLVEIPSEDPKTLTGPKKEKFERVQKKEDRLEKLAADIKQMREEKKK